MKPVRLVLVLLLLLLQGAASAFEPCQAGTAPCPTPAQVLAYVVVPTVLLAVLGRFAFVHIGSKTLRLLAVITLSGAWLLGLLAFTVASGMFLAPCEANCWFKF